MVGGDVKVIPLDDHPVKCICVELAMATEKTTLLIRLHDSTKESLRMAALAEERSMAWLGEKLIAEGLRQRGYLTEPKPKRTKK